MPGLAISHAAPVLPSAQSAPASAASSSNWDFSFHNLLGIINPLQHLPVIGTLYRAITGDKIGAPEKIAGDAIYGGLWGAVSSIADTAFEAATGKDFGDTVISLFTGGDKSSAVAANSDTPAPVHKDFGDRLLALFDSSDNKMAVAANGTHRDFGQRLLALFNGDDNDTMTGVAAAAPAPANGNASNTASTTASVAKADVAATPVMPPTADVVAFNNALIQKGINGDTAQRAMMAYRRSVAPQSTLLAVAN